MKSFSELWSDNVWRAIKNRSGYSEREIEVLKNTPWASKFGDYKISLNWIKVEMIKTNRCTVGWKEGQCLYFDFSGMLIRWKAPAIICTHAIAQLSPVMYQYLDRLARGADPENMQIDYVSCTDTGFDHKGMGNNLMKITCEKMPFFELMRYMLVLGPKMLFRSTNVRGTDPGGME